MRVNLHYRYFDGGDSLKDSERRLRRARAKKLHRMKYDFRPFPHWSAGEAGATRLLSPSSYGLLSGRADRLVSEDRLEDLALWREVMQGPELEEPVSRCDQVVDGVVCGCELEPKGVAVGARWRIEERYPGVRWRCGLMADEEQRARQRGPPPAG